MEGCWRKGPWSPDEDRLLIEYISQFGEGRWSYVSKCTGYYFSTNMPALAITSTTTDYHSNHRQSPLQPPTTTSATTNHHSDHLTTVHYYFDHQLSGLKRNGKSCRLRWVNYLRPGLKKGHLTPQEEGIIIELHAIWGNKWSTIARYLPGRTDNEIKNYWRTHFKKTNPSSYDPDSVQEKKRILKQKQKQQSQVDQKNIINKFLQECDQGKNLRQDEADIAFLGIDDINDHNTMFNDLQDNYTSCSDFIPVDCYLWGGLWDFDDPNGCSKM
ncbi:hypothetical protein OROMI_000552 [Orobanche minor]